MSIEVTGPEKYEFQDFVCLLTAMRLRDREAVQGFIEPEGLEDALFSIQENGAAIDVELQVKGSQERVNIRYEISRRRAKETTRSSHSSGREQDTCEP